MTGMTEQGAASPVVEVVGAVDVHGPGGIGKDPRTLRFVVDRWRMVGGELQPAPLTVSRTVSDTEWRTLVPQVKAYAILRLRVCFREGLSEALLEELVGRAADTELQEHVEKLQQPVSHEDDVFGTLSLNRRADWYEGGAVWNGARTRLHVRLDDNRDLGPALRTAHLLWQNQAAWNARILECAVAKLLPIKNGRWLEEGEAQITADEFRSRMKLQDVGVNPDGSFEFWFGTRDLFTDHAILVYGDITRGPSTAVIEG